MNWTREVLWYPCLTNVTAYEIADEIFTHEQNLWWETLIARTLQPWFCDNNLAKNRFVEMDMNRYCVVLWTCRYTWRNQCLKLIRRSMCCVTANSRSLLTKCVCLTRHCVSDIHEWVYMTDYVFYTFVRHHCSWIAAGLMVDVASCSLSARPVVVVRCRHRLLSGQEDLVVRTNYLTAPVPHLPTIVARKPGTLLLSVVWSVAWSRLAGKLHLALSPLLRNPAVVVVGPVAAPATVSLSAAVVPIVVGPGFKLLENISDLINLTD